MEAPLYLFKTDHIRKFIKKRYIGLFSTEELIFLHWLKMSLSNTGDTKFIFRTLVFA